MAFHTKTIAKVMSEGPLLTEFRFENFNRENQDLEPAIETPAAAKW